MSRHSSAISASTSAPTIANGHVNLPQVPEKQTARANRAASMSVSKLLPVDDSHSADVDPDELFAKHTISEVKFVQQRLRADADAKQEELRLMVGILRSDLESVENGTATFYKHQQMETVCGLRVILGMFIEPTKADAHLHTLQLLSAHVKLLLDAPEHLWRLIERKKYFPAAWLFLLARVVHRALVREDEQDITWASQGVDVLEEFPLVQRQWDTVSQFRSQIIHKATLSLREYDSPIEDTCSTLLTLHLLDSRPLMETLSVFLAQRSKTLRTLLSWKYDSDSAESQTKKQNGHALGSRQPTVVVSEFRRRPVKEIKEATRTALDAISQTVKTAQSVFQEEADGSQPSLIRRVLEYIQSDLPTPPQAQTLPTELCLTTQTLLTTLPSSTHFLLLPPDLKSYKPYVDLNSSSSSIQHSQFAQKLDEWLRKSTADLHKAVTRWFSELHSVKELWSVRASTQRWLLASGLRKDEVTQMAKTVDELCRHRVVEIWKLKLEGSLDSFGRRLDSTLLSLAEGGKAKNKEASPVGFLFQAPLIPNSSQGGPVDTSFQKYTTSLRRQLVGRTAMLDDVLATLESCARTIRQDLAHVMTGVESPELVKQLETAYRPDADALCANVIRKLEKTANSPEELSNSDGLVFLSRVSDELSSTSPFISEIGCQPSVTQDFRKTTAALHDRVVDRWRTYTVSTIVREHRLANRPLHPALKASKPSGPSSDLVQSLLTLSTSIQDLGLPRSQAWQRPLVKTTVEHFITEFTGNDCDKDSLQSLYDLAFLWKLATLHGDVEDHLSSRLEQRLQENVSLALLSIDPLLTVHQIPADLDLETLHKNATDSLARTQTLLATLLPPQPHIPTPDSMDKFSALLQFGIPPQEGQFQPAIELAKPTSRFGLLLVGGT
ncbi:hypothetical protein DXG01_009953 [Tephrocybe rancida]|nr:hypothetical protein DXG01_009953 [Tephrocybe rancida]